MFGNKRSGNPTQIKALTTAQDGCQHLLRFGGGENEFHMLRWFFQCFQQRIKCRRGEHVNLVNNVNFIMTASRGEPDVLAELADLFNAVVTGAVDFKNVETVALCDFKTDITHATRINRWTFYAVQCLGQNSCC